MCSHRAGVPVPCFGFIRARSWSEEVYMMKCYIKTVKCILLCVGVYLTAYIIATPGDQVLHAIIGGACLSMSAYID